MPFTIPRSFDRGLIEAVWGVDFAAGPPGIPRSFDRGLIEAGPALRA